AKRVSPIRLDLATERIFQALTATDEDGRAIRNPLVYSTLVQYVQVKTSRTGYADADAATRVVVNRFSSFLRVDGTTSKRSTNDIDATIDADSIIDIGHEALIRCWDKLGANKHDNWIQHEQRDASRYRDLLRAAANNAILSGETLKEFSDWWFRRQPSQFWAQRYTKAHEPSHSEAHRVITRSREEAKARVQEAAKNSARILARAADAIRLPSRYSGPADSLATLLQKSTKVPVVDEYVQALYDGLRGLREIRRVVIPSGFQKQVFALSFSPTEKLLAAAVSGDVLFYDTGTAELIWSQKINSGWVVSLRWSPDGQRLYVGTSPKGIIIAPYATDRLRRYGGREGGEWKDLLEIGDEQHPAG